MDYITTWKEVIQRPSDFYRRMPKTGGYADPLTFAAINLIVYGLLGALLAALFGREMYMGGMYGGMSNARDFGFFTLLGTVIVTPIAGIISILIDAVILYIIYKILGGAGTYEGTVRFISYATAVLLLTWIPFVGWIIGLYGLYLQIVGGMYVHNVSMGKSIIAILLPTILIAILMAIFIAAIIAFLGIFV